MKKCIAMLMAAAILLFACAACATAPAAPAGPATLKILVSHSYIDGYRNRLEVNYKKKHKDVKLEMIPLTIPPRNMQEREASLKKLQIEIMAGEGPDMYLLDKYDAGALFPDLYKTMESGVFCDLTPYLNKSVLQNEAQYYTKIFDVGKIGNAQWLLPLSFDFVTVLGENLNAKAAAKNETPAQFIQRLLPLFPAEDYTSLGSLAYTLHTANAEPIFDYANKTLNLSAEFEACMAISLAIAEHTSGNVGPSVPTKEYPVVPAMSYAIAACTALQSQWAGGKIEQQPVPNGTGGVTACVTSFAAIGMNCKNKQAAADFIEGGLLSPTMQCDAGDGPDIWENAFLGEKYNFSVSKALLEPFSRYQFIWALSALQPEAPTPKELEAVLATVQADLDAVNACRFDSEMSPADLAIVSEYHQGNAKGKSIADVSESIAAEYRFYFDE